MIVTYDDLIEDEFNALLAKQGQADYDEYIGFANEGDTV